MESLEEPVLLEKQTTRSETPTAAWPEQKKGIAVCSYMTQLAMYIAIANK